MRYRWKKGFHLRCFRAPALVFLCACFLCGFLTGCQEAAVLYDSDGSVEELLPEESSASGESGGGREAASEEGGEAAAAEPAAQTLCVYVCGEVRAPGVYELPEGSRIVDAVEAAGGMTEAASGTWLNLAEPVSDGQKIEVPSETEASELEKEQQEAQSGLVNLNTASAEELMTLTGIGESKAEAILSYREEHGGFEKPEELMEIPGIKEGVFEKIRDQVTV